MSPKLASVCCALFILWLFFRDERRKRISNALWLPLTWVFLIGSKPISLWFGYADAGTEGYVEGSPFDRLVILFLILAGCFVLARRGINWSRFYQNNRWVCLYFLYLALSTLWSDYPFVSFKRWFKDAGNVVMVLVILTEAQPLEAVKTLLSRCVFLCIPMSTVLIKYYPELGRYYDLWTYQPYYAGITTNKNSLGMTLFVCGLSLFWMLLELYPPKARIKSLAKKEFYIYLLLMALTIWLLTKAQSSTALACTILGGLIMFGMRFSSIRSKARHLFSYTFGIGILFLSLHVTLDLGGAFVQLLGRDMTFTGRTEIWAMLLKEPVNPVFGEGFYSFWMGDRVKRLSEQYYYDLNEAHNGYLETYLNSGLVGLALLLTLFAAAGSRIQREIVAGSGYATFRIAFLVSSIIYNITEAAFDRLDLLWFCLLLVIVEYPSRGKASFTKISEPLSADTLGHQPAGQPTVTLKEPAFRFA